MIVGKSCSCCCRFGSDHSLLVHVANKRSAVLEWLREMINDGNLTARLYHRAENAVTFRALTVVKRVSCEDTWSLLSETAWENAKTLLFWCKISNVHPRFCNDLSDRSILLLLTFATITAGQSRRMIEALWHFFDDNGLPANRFLESRLV